MKVRASTADAAVKTAMTAVGAATLTVCLALAVAACTTSPSSTHPAIFTPSASASGPHSGASASSSPRASSSAKASSSAPASPRSSGARGSAASTPSYPTAAPQTGGGGTAGLQDGMLFAAGGLAVLAGAGSLVLRRRFKRPR